MAAFFICSIVAAIFLIIGISGRKSKEAVGFFTFVDPPVVNDVRRYNCSVSWLWIAGAAIFEMMNVPMLFLGQNSPYYIFYILGMMVWVIGMMIAYLRIEKKYKA